MNEFFDKTKQELRAKKEFVYEQWRRVLCLAVVDTDISDNENQPKDITSEQIRAVFNSGYKMAMLQTRESLKAELYESTNIDEKRVIERLLTEVEDRLATSKCIVSYSKEEDKEMLSQSFRREAEFSRYLSESLSTWDVMAM
jgi:methylase of polypeptide subunit release factors